MFTVGDRVRIKSDDDFNGDTGTVVLITEDAGGDLNYIVDLDDNDDEIDPFVLLITMAYGVPASSVPFSLDQLSHLD